MCEGIWRVLVAVILSYLLGSIPTSFLLGRLRGVDLRRQGSGNVGATNAFRVLGPLPGVISLILDIGKGLVAITVLARICGPQPTNWIKILIGLAVIAGHNWTVFLKFKGGKGVATSSGVFLGLAPYAVLFSALLWLIVVPISRYVSLGSILAAISLPVFIWWTEKEITITLFGLLISLLVVIRHQANIKRLIKGEESKVGRGKKIV
ncbi:glycerol-3-phosphate 1-O-acyltransferase PlsY [candidate division NPL-UPA2 bacterium]|nr:glycerol-3-phosphate 1-O-acyltransferase PlsY [candidate division NPL-UPA2 bacterium]